MGKEIEEEMEFWEEQLKKKGFEEVTESEFNEQESFVEESRKIQLRVNNEEADLYFLKGLKRKAGVQKR